MEEYIAIKSSSVSNNKYIAFFFFISAKKIINLQMSLFMGTTLIMGAAAAVISNFIFLFMVKYLNASETLYGFRMVRFYA